MAVATLAMGCFWGPDARYGRVDGVLRTRVGYAGGTTVDPVYGALGDHMEALELEFDPARVSFRALLDEMWRAHNPVKRRTWQYRSAIFAHDDEQARVAAQARDREASRRGRQLTTWITSAWRFYPAEDGHQKHHLQRYPALFGALVERLGSPAAVFASPVVSRLNGTLAGFGSRETLDRDGELITLLERLGAEFLPEVRALHSRHANA